NCDVERTSRRVEGRPIIGNQIVSAIEVLLIRSSRRGHAEHGGVKHFTQCRTGTNWPSERMDIVSVNLRHPFVCNSFWTQPTLHHGARRLVSVRPRFRTSARRCVQSAGNVWPKALSNRLSTTHHS